MARVTVSQLSSDVAALAASVEALANIVAGQSRPVPATPLPEPEPEPRKTRETREYGPMGQCIAYRAKPSPITGKPRACKQDATHIVTIGGSEHGLCDTHFAMFNAGTLVHTRADEVHVRRIQPDEAIAAAPSRVKASQNAPAPHRADIAADAAATVANRGRESHTPTCRGTVKSTGKPCGSHILIGDTGYCIAHQSQAATARKSGRGRGSVKVSPVARPADNPAPEYTAPVTNAPAPAVDPAALGNLLLAALAGDRTATDALAGVLPMLKK